MSSSLIAGIALLILPIGFNVAFLSLQRSFEYPDILRKPTDYIFQKFSAGGSRLIGLWYAFMLTGLLFIPIALLVQNVFAAQRPFLAGISGIIGVLAGLVQAFGLIRWTFLVPVLARRYNDPSTSSTAKEAIGVVFEAFHNYAGVAIGEHLGYIFTSAWTIVVSVMMASSPIFGGLLALLGIVAAIGIFIGVFEQSGFKAAGAINAISYLVWSLWMILAGIALILAR